jgi:hypothetical protein
MYISFQGENGTKSYLKQYDLSLPDSLVIETAITIDSSATQKYGALQFGPDGRIYMAIEGSEYLATIGEPEGNSLTGVDYERDGANLGGKKSQLGLPNMVQDFTQESQGPGFEADGFCTNEPTTFQASPMCDPIEDTYSWDFLGDGSIHRAIQATAGDLHLHQTGHVYGTPCVLQTNVPTPPSFRK